MVIIKVGFVFIIGDKEKENILDSRNQRGDEDKPEEDNMVAA